MESSLFCTPRGEMKVVMQRSKEWFALREGRVTASTLYKILATEGPPNNMEAPGRPYWYYFYKTVGHLYELPGGFEGNEATDHGTRIEPGITAAIEEAFGFPSEKGTEDGFCLPHADSPIASLVGASPDYYIEAADVPEETRAWLGVDASVPINGEWKAPFYRMYGGERNVNNCVPGTRVPRKYLAQMQLAMYATGSPVCLFCVYYNVPGGAAPEIYVASVYASERYFRFFERCVLRFHAWLLRYDMDAFRARGGCSGAEWDEFRRQFCVLERGYSQVGLGQLSFDAVEGFPLDPNTGEPDKMFRWREPVLLEEAEASVRIVELRVDLDRFARASDARLAELDEIAREMRRLFEGVNADSETDYADRDVDGFIDLFLQTAAKLERLFGKKGVLPPVEELFDAASDRVKQEWRAMCTAFLDATPTEQRRRVRASEWAHASGVDVEARVSLSDRVHQWAKERFDCGQFPVFDDLASFLSIQSQ